MRTRTLALVTIIVSTLVVMRGAGASDQKSAPLLDPALLKKPLVYFTATRRDRSDLVASSFGLMSGALAHGPNYVGYLAEDPKPGGNLGKVP